TLHVIRRVEPNLGVYVAPVGGEPLERALPLVVEAVTPAEVGAGRLRGAHELERATDSFVVEAAQQTARAFGRDRAAAARGGDADVLPAATRIRGTEHRGRAIAASVVADREHQRRLGPVGRQLALD